MSPAEFDSIARMLPKAGGRTRAAARLVLVDGLSRSQAARESAVSVAPVNALVKRILELQQTGCPTCGRPAMEG